VRFVLARPVVGRGTVRAYCGRPNSAGSGVANPQGFAVALAFAFTGVGGEVGCGPLGALCGPRFL